MLLLPKVEIKGDNLFSLLTSCGRNKLAVSQLMPVQWQDRWMARVGRKEGRKERKREKRHASRYNWIQGLLSFTSPLPLFFLLLARLYIFFRRGSSIMQLQQARKGQLTNSWLLPGRFTPQKPFCLSTYPGRLIAWLGDKEEFNKPKTIKKTGNEGPRWN
jgi:hypothetical protein